MCPVNLNWLGFFTHVHMSMFHDIIYVIEAKNACHIAKHSAVIDVTDLLASPSTVNNTTFVPVFWTDTISVVWLPALTETL